MRRLISLVVAIVSLCCISPSRAADGWHATRVTGEVRVEIGSMPAAPLTLTTTIASDALIETAASGSATLVRGDDQIVVAPNSRLRLPANDSGGMTRIIEEFGELFFQVGKRTQPHFRVETPLLAATVKGTSFTVAVDDKGTNVQVREGLVMVQNTASSDTTYVAAGRAASVAVAQPMDLYLDKTIVPPAALHLGDADAQGAERDAALVSPPRLPAGQRRADAANTVQAVESSLMSPASQRPRREPTAIVLDSTLSGIGVGIIAAALAIGFIGTSRLRPGLAQAKAKRSSDQKKP